MPPRRACCSSLRRFARSPASERALRSFSTTRTNSPASGTVSKPSTSTGSAGAGRLDALARVVGHRAHAAPVGAGDDRVADLQRAALDEHGDDRATARIELGLDHGAGGLRVRVGGELLDLGRQQQALEQVVEALVRLGRDVDEHRVAAPLLGLEPELGHLGADAVGLRAFLVDLVDRDHDRHVGRLRVVDGLARLRAHAVVGGDHDHGDVRRLGAAGTHGGERLVARGVQERDDRCRPGGPGRRRCAA